LADGATVDRTTYAGPPTLPSTKAQMSTLSDLVRFAIS
jgi:hypothetical protein